jgi:type IV pilus assembly protein PilV
MTRRTQTGAGLIEALVSVFVVSIGFIGFAGLQLNGLAASNNSLLRSKAVLLSYQMADRVRANLPGAAGGAYNSLTGDPTSPGCISTGCTPAQVALNDYAEWSAEVASVLPAGTGTICLTSTPDACDGTGDVYAITLTWTEKGTQHTFVNTLRP